MGERGGAQGRGLVLLQDDGVVKSSLLHEANTIYCTLKEFRVDGFVAGPALGLECREPHSLVGVCPRLVFEFEVWG